jgi:hypothetical protein
MDFPEKGPAAELAWQHAVIQRHGFDGTIHPTPISLFRRDLLRVVNKGFL